MKKTLEQKIDSLKITADFYLNEWKKASILKDKKSQRKTIEYYAKYEMINSTIRLLEE